MSSQCCKTKEITEEKKPINWPMFATVISGIGTVVGFLLSYGGVTENITNKLFLMAIIVGGIFVVKEAFEGIAKKKFLNMNS